MASFKSADVLVKNGGTLATSVSGDSTDINGYVDKLNWRRAEPDQEKVREGDARFYINTDLPIGNQYKPGDGDEPITLVFNARGADGSTAVIVGTPTKLYRYYALTEDDVYTRGPLIKAVDPAAKTFEIEGDWTGEFAASDTFYVEQSCANDGKYTVASDSYDAGTDRTTITVDEAIPSERADGVIVRPVYGYTIGDVATGTPAFKVSGDQTAAFLDTNTFRVVGTALNNGLYSCDGDSTYDGSDTIITVNEVIPSGTVEGFIMPVYGSAGSGSWLEVGSGFSSFDPEVSSGCPAEETAHRWEAVNINGYTIFNNGYDLPVTYNIKEFEVKPIYELREQGIAFVGTISEFNGMLLCSDVAEINTDYLDTVMNGADPYGVFRDPQRYDRRKYRSLYSPIGEPRRWGAGVNGSINAGSTSLTIAWPVESFEVGDDITITGAGVASGDLETSIIAVSGTTITVGNPAVTSVSDQLVYKTTNAGLAPIPGYYDLQDDGSGILRTTQLRQYAVALKQTSIFIGSYTGVSNDPIQWRRVYNGEDNLFWQWCMVNVRGEYLIFPSDKDFFVFTLSTQAPRPHPKLSLCRNLFFDYASVNNDLFASINGATQEAWFHVPDASGYKAVCYDYRYDSVSVADHDYLAADTVTKPNDGTTEGAVENFYVGGNADGELLLYGLSELQQPAFGDKKEIYSRGGRSTGGTELSQTGTTVTAALGVFEAGDVGKIIEWDSGETATISGFTNSTTVTVDEDQTVSADTAFIHGSDFTARLTFGWGDFNDAFNEKDIRSYLPLLASQSDNPPITVSLEAKETPNSPANLIGSVVLESPKTNGLIPLYHKAHSYRDKIVITGRVGARLTGRVWEYVKIRTQSIVRRETS